MWLQDKRGCVVFGVIRGHRGKRKKVISRKVKERRRGCLIQPNGPRICLVALLAPVRIRVKWFSGMRVFPQKTVAKNTVGIGIENNTFRKNRLTKSNKNLCVSWNIHLPGKRIMIFDKASQSSAPPKTFNGRRFGSGNSSAAAAFIGEGIQ